MPSQSNNSNKVNKSSRTKQLNKHGSPRKFMMSSSISSTIKEVQGSSSGQKVQQVLTLSKLTGSTLQFSTSVEVRLGIVGQLVGQLVSKQFFSKTALRISQLFCMKVPYYKGQKLTRRFFQKNTGSFKNHKNVFLNDPVKYRPFSSVWLIGST